MVAAAAVLASGCARNESAAGLPDDRYCDSLREVEDAVDAHVAAYVELGPSSDARAAAELAQLSREVALAAEEAGDLAGAEASSSWSAFVFLYRRQARALDDTARPFDAILDLEEGRIEWSAAADSVSSQIEEHARLWCAFEPELGS